MTSRLRVRTCGAITPRVRPRPVEWPAASNESTPPARDVASEDSSESFGVIVFESGSRQARRVVLAFETPLAAAAYAVEHQLPDYLVAPLSFLAPAGVPRS